MREIPDPAHTECTSCAHHRKREAEIFCHRRAPMMAGDGSARWPRVTEFEQDGCSEYVQYSGEQLNQTNY